MRWRLRATLDIHFAVFRAGLPLVQAYVNAMKAVWLHARDTGIRAYPATTECYDPPQTRGAVPDEIIVDECPQCGGTGWADDPSACSDPEHCTPSVPCPNGCIPEPFDNDPFPERKIENWANQTERLAGQPFPPDKLN